MRLSNCVPVAGAVLALILFAGVANAATVKITKGDYTASSGGEYNVSANNLGPTSFQSFCLEHDENLTFGMTYYAKVNTEAVDGGAGGPSPDPIDSMTAYLYYNFWNRTLDNYDFADTTDAGRLGSAKALQRVIWYIEDEISKPFSDNDGSLEESFYSDAANAVKNGDWSGIGNVRVLNLTDRAGNKIQDVLVVVPLPAAGLAGLLLLGGLGALSLRRRRARSRLV